MEKESEWRNVGDWLEEKSTREIKNFEQEKVSKGEGRCSCCKERIVVGHITLSFGNMRQWWYSNE